MRHGRPKPEELHPFYARYVERLPDGDILERLASQIEETRALLSGVGPERESYRYAPDKWSIREVVGHLVDAERVFGVRALSFAREDATPLPGFDENAWAAASNAGDRPLAELLDELGAVRASTVALLRSFPDEAWGRWGTASGKRFTVRALAWVMAGHEDHHRRILRERYLSTGPVT